MAIQQQKKIQNNPYFVRKAKAGFDVVEKNTNLVVKRCKDHITATNYKVRLNRLRAGFQGFTPTFFAEKVA